MARTARASIGGICYPVINHRHYHSNGHIWQGRFKAFPIQQDGHYLTVLRYVERNPVRAERIGGHPYRVPVKYKNILPEPKN